MGMYDVINGEQVKCFYIPLYYYSEIEEKLTKTGINHSCGMLRNYKNRNKLPIKTAWYKYPKNFIIADNRVDPDMYLCPNCGEIYYEKIDICEKCKEKLTENCKVLGITHIVKDGRVSATCYNVDKISSNVFKDNELVVDYYGNAIENINSSLDLKDFFLNYKKYLTKLIEIQKKYSHYFNDYINELKGQNKGDLSKNSKKVEELHEIYEKSLVDREKEINYLRKQTLSKYNSEYDYKYLDVMRFGEYITCFLDMKKRINKYNREDDLNQFLHLKKEFNNFLKENEKITDKYFLWNETTDEEKEKIEDILKEI